MPPEVWTQLSYPAARACVRRHGPKAMVVVHQLAVPAESRGGLLVARAGVIEPRDSRPGLTFDPGVNLAGPTDADEATATPTRFHPRSRAARHADHVRLSLLAAD